ncbi:hypothetical protein [Novosphingobium album (ex Hu et al. 2023)]|uniref:Uncharacterized protein n=1 Tax=Novosphingobium album (ex Hu et al. 2023) TaxID=2930093 RepID=A0ABT0B755_9SPHN|nr:hypothetical protein [Novosphingobium album (ex Hu et al. 2023)]MCJ2180833.1 hypothetical protein [Novosphingobium album (ex Hu et al. 2023)]
MAVYDLDQPRAYLTRIAGNLVRDEARMAVRHAQDLHVNADDCELAAPDPVAALEARDLLSRVNAATRSAIVGKAWPLWTR